MYWRILDSTSFRTSFQAGIRLIARISFAVKSKKSPADECSRVCFFFQAEDGIRDYKVTGVQTCALPISHAQAIDRDGLLGAQDLVDLGLALPLFLGLAVVQLCIDPGDQATGQRCAEE